MSKDIFISYSSKNEDTALELVKNLEEKKLSYWFAPLELVGKQHDAEISPAIKQSKIFLIFLSQYSRPRKGHNDASRWVRDELLVARGCHKKCILPVKLDDTVDEETDNLMFNGLPNYFDLTKNTISSLINFLENLLKDDNYKVNELEYATFQKEERMRLIKSIEDDLKNGYNKEANDTIKQNAMLKTKENESYILLLETIAYMMGKNIKDMNSKQISTISKKLKILEQTDFANVAIYLKSMLSKSYFEFNGIHNESQSYKKLKLISNSMPNIKAKHYLITRNIKNVLSSTEYELEWKSMTKIDI